MRQIVYALLVAGGLCAAEPIVLNPDGAWCWFQDERALMYDGKLTVGSISRQGNVQATTWDMQKGQVSIFTLREKFQIDDHNVPGFLLRGDGRLMAFYTWHGGTTLREMY